MFPPWHFFTPKRSRKYSRAPSAPCSDPMNRQAAQRAVKRSYHVIEGGAFDKLEIFPEAHLFTRLLCLTTKLTDSADRSIVDSNSPGDDHRSAICYDGPSTVQKRDAEAIPERLFLVLCPPIAAPPVGHKSTEFMEPVVDASGHYSFVRRRRPLLCWRGDVPSLWSVVKTTTKTS
jgi:hypothetical protein